jgi:NAD-dependent dihydropyrimidine dehydrogenase PreA subunit
MVNWKRFKDGENEINRTNKGVFALPKVTVNLDMCEGAGVCAEVCPMNVYDMVEIKGKKKAKPTRMEDCIMCMACVNSCPTQAITVEEE